ncbi:hypothetical protein [Rossellomorea marisflavi]|uniref:hypothetical protein n=1 Tax=Rossellomorea marisflavi TaxID=189381 RepID=UPI00345D8205
MSKNTSTEESSMKDYLKHKYEQEFEVGEIQEFNRGFAAGKLIQAKATPSSKNQMVFIISRESNHSNYEDSYSELLQERFVMELFSSHLSELDENLKYYIKTAYIGDFRGKEEIELNKLNPSFVISIPVEPKYNKDDYIEKIQNFIYSIENEEVGYYRVRIDFVEKKHIDIIEQYIELSQKHLTQVELKEKNFSEVKSQYEQNIIGKFVYDSKDVDFENNPNFIRSLFNKRYEGR